MAYLSNGVVIPSFATEGWCVTVQLNDTHMSLQIDSLYLKVKFQCNWCDAQYTWDDYVPEKWVVNDNFPLYKHIVTAVENLHYDKGVCPKVAQRASGLL